MWRRGGLRVALACSPAKSSQVKRQASDQAQQIVRNAQKTKMQQPQAASKLHATWRQGVHGAKLTGYDHDMACLPHTHAHTHNNRFLPTKFMAARRVDRGRNRVQDVKGIEWNFTC